MPSDFDPLFGAQPPAAATVCSLRAAGHTPHRAQILLCHTGKPTDWRTVVVMGVLDDVVTLAVGDELWRYRNHTPLALAAAVADAGPHALVNLRYGFLFLSSWPHDPEGVFSICPADRPFPSCD